jgi:hypothetical protein
LSSVILPFEIGVIDLPCILEAKKPRAMRTSSLFTVVAVMPYSTISALKAFVRTDSMPLRQESFAL